jgi:hypothetical protein
MIHGNDSVRQGLDALPVFLTQRAVAELLGLSERTLERFRAEGRGPAFRKFGRRVIYGREDVLSWSDAQRRTSTSDTGETAR